MARLLPPLSLHRLLNTYRATTAPTSIVSEGSALALSRGPRDHDLHALSPPYGSFSNTITNAERACGGRHMGHT